MTKRQQADDDILRAENRELLSEVTGLRKRALTEARVIRALRGLASQPLSPPRWLTSPGKRNSAHGRLGTPTLFASDWHIGEVVDPMQIRGVNEYDLDIARARWRRMIEQTIDLLHRYFAAPKYDGIVFALDGDIVSGDIHEELSQTNALDIGPCILEAASLITGAALTLRDAFGRVFVPAVVGNHGRFSRKPRAKSAAYTNADWIAYQIAARELRGEVGIQFAIPSGPDAAWTLYSHRYLMTHGDAMRGGDGIIGPIGPVFRGDAKRRAMRAQVGDAYNTFLIGHFHQLRMDSRVIMNGSGVGYNEYASKLAFPYEIPKQALWLTHPDRGVTFSVPVFLADPPKQDPAEWLTWKKAEI